MTFARVNSGGLAEGHFRHCTTNKNNLMSRSNFVLKVTRVGICAGF